MRIFTEILKKFNKQNKNNLLEQEVTIQEQIAPKEPFVAENSIYELEDTDWLEFGRILKQNKVLPNSYLKNPSKVEVKSSKNGKPIVVLTFNSATSNSVRKFMLLPDKAFQYINGAIDDGKNQTLNNIWKAFQDRIKLVREIKLKRESYQNVLRAEEMLEDAKKMMTYRNIYQLEQSFLEKYKNVRFREFCYIPAGKCIIDTIPAFIPLNDSENGENKFLDPAVPFSPKTLEFCIVRMTKEKKTELGEYTEDFEDMCRELQENSCYESENWDRVIEIGKDIVEKHYKESINKSGLEK